MKRVLRYSICVLFTIFVYGCNKDNETQNDGKQPTVFSEDKVVNITINEIKSGKIKDNVYYKFTGKIWNGGYQRYSFGNFPWMLICDVNEKPGTEDLNGDGIINDNDISQASCILVSFFADSEINKLKQLRTFDTVTILATSYSIGYKIKEKIDESYLESFVSNNLDFETLDLEY